jgi:hypothetical protein
VITLTNVGTAYDTIPASKGLGCGLIDFTGVAQVTLAVKANKVGTGTQSWQLWNETDGAQIGVINDPGPTGDKTLQQTFDVSGAGLTGLKLCRIRCKSTVAGDDPVYYGGTVLAR